MSASPAGPAERLKASGNRRARPEPGTPCPTPGRPHWRWIVLLVLSCGVGVGLRFANLGGKTPYLDESATALRVGGHSVQQFCAFLERSDAASPAELRRFQQLDPSRGAWDTVASLAAEEPQHPPLYYALMRVWAGMAGDSLATLRAGAALLSLLAIPGLLWLGRELWRDARTTLAAVALWSVSPFFVTYAQDAREYGLWSALTLMASAAFLHAVRTDRGWWSYGLLTAAGLSTSLLFASVPAAHGAWLAITREARCRWKSLMAAWGMALVLFSPWVLGGFRHRDAGLEQIAWLQSPRPLVGLVRSWGFGVGSVVFDVHGPGANGLLLTTLGCAVAVAVATGWIAWWRSDERQGAWLALFLIAANALPLAGADLIWGGCRSTVPRFLVTAWVGELLVLAWLSSRRPLLLASALGLGLVAGLVRVPAETWWNKYSGPRHMALAAAVNAETAPLLVATPRGHHFNLLTLSHMLGGHVRVGPRSLAYDRSRFSDVFLLQRPGIHAASPVPAEAVLVLDTGHEQLWRIPTTASGITPR